MKKFTTTTPDPEFNIPSGEVKTKRKKPGQADPPQEGEQKRQVDLERLSHEEDQQDDPEPAPDDG